MITFTGRTYFPGLSLTLGTGTMLLVAASAVAGKLRLVGVEWFVPLATGVKKRPVLFGQPFDGPMEGHEPTLPLTVHHYDLHTCLWKENPNGLFSGSNPAVKCTGYEYTVVEEHAP